MTDARSPSFDEALWFPAHMSTGDSPGRPGSDVGDGTGGGSGDDGIGLPIARRGRGGPRPPKKPGIRAASWVWLTLFGAAAAGIVVVAARKEIAAEIGQAWLKGQGVEAKLKFDTLSLGHTSGHLLIGSAGHPELSIDRFDAEYVIHLWGGGQPLTRIRTLHIVHPVGQVSLKGGKLNFGSLDRLVQNALSAKPSDSAPPDSIVVDDADVRLLTDYGTLNVRGGVSLDAGRLKTANLTVPAARLSGPMGGADLTGASVTARRLTTAQGEQIALQAHAAANSATLGDRSPVEDAGPPSRLENLELSLDARLPYRNAKAFLDAFSGASQATLGVRAAAFHGEGADAGDIEANLTLDGQVKLGADAQTFDGTARLTGRAATARSSDAKVTGLRLEASEMSAHAGMVSGSGLSLSVKGPAAGDAATLRQGGVALDNAHLNLASLDAGVDDQGANVAFRGTATAGRFAASDLTLSDAGMTLDGAFHSESDSGDWTFGLNSDQASGQGAYKGLAAIARAQAEGAAAQVVKQPPGTPARPVIPDGVVMLDRAFERFQLRATGLKVAMTGQGVEASPAPQIDIRLKGAVADLDGGGTATLTPAAGKPVLSGGHDGAFNITVDGPDLPHVALDVSRFGLAPSGSLSGAFALNSTFTVAPVSQSEISGSGSFITTPAGEIRVALSEPATIKVHAAELGDHIENIKATVTQGGDSFLIAGPAGWRVAGAVHGLSLEAPNEQIGLNGGEGTFKAFSIPGSPVVGLDASLTAGTITDALPESQTRFYALGISGTLTQDARALKGRFIATTPKALSGGKAAPIAAIDLDNDVATSAGALSFRTLDLTFDPHGLQPVFLSPTVAAIFSKDVSGKASFDGAFTWTKSDAASHGRLKIDGLNFTGAAGVSQGLKGEIDFTSLAPLISEPHQMLGIDTIQLGIPLRDLHLDVQFLGDHLAVEAADVTTPGGKVELQPMTVPFDGVSPISGTMTFDGLDFGKIIAATSLGDSMTYQGTVSGKLPFVVDGGHVSFAQGFMASDASGMISIKSLTGVNASGTLSSPDTKAIAAAPPADFNPFQDLAFQALEYLAYDQIDARINSVKGGILDINFHIKGHFAPPKRQKATISLMDYANGSWMKKPIKLPSNTPVELFLDVPVNLDEILNDLTAFNVRTAQKPQ